jgi:diguanylate cyclase (GGDEF)-like protein
MKLKMKTAGISLLWVGLIMASFLWNYSSAKYHQQEIAFQTARSFFDLIVLTREWNSGHGGVYVPITSRTRPNPYLRSPARDLVINDKLALTLINPAFMTRQISEIAQKRNIAFHITSMNPIRPQNKPTKMEMETLQAFEKGAAERGVFLTLNKGKKSFFYMAPLKTKKACLKCHAEQGYQLGDIRGGISITFPFTLSVPITALLFGHLGIGLLGLAGILFSGRRLQDAYEIIHKQAACDELTGLANRRSFSERIETEFGRACRKGAPLSLLLCDIDHFKSYNDTFGHGAGDECLKRVAGRIRGSLKRPSDFCARYGGEEFIIILPETGLFGARQVAERIRKNIEDLAIKHEDALHARIVTVSVGIASTERASFRSHGELIKYADIALYEAKKNGRNRVVCLEGCASTV